MSELVNQETVLAPKADVPKSHEGAWDKVELAAAAAFLAFQQSPGNEMTRAYIGTNILAETHNPLLVGAGVGLSTLVIEGASSLPIANVLNNQTETVERIKKRFKKSKDRVGEASKSNRLTDVSLALGVGTAAVVVKRHMQENDRTLKKDRKTIARTAGGIAVFSAGIASLASGGIEYADKVGLGAASEATLDVVSDWKTYAGIFAATQAYSGAKKGIDRVLKNKELSKMDYQAQIVLDKREIQMALDLEQEIWNQKNYGSLDPYKKYLEQSRVFAVFDKGKCLGVTRLFGGTPETPPFIDEMPISDSAVKEDLLEGCQKATVEELGIAAVSKEAPSIKVCIDLWRLAWRDANARGIKTWGIIMEPKRVEIMKKRYGFPFQQISPEIDYQGGMCAAHIMNFEDVHTHMSTERPDYYNWFVKEPI